MARAIQSATLVPSSLRHRKARGAGHERREEILAAAKALFLKHGVESVSTRQIAERVGISQTALYVYFENRGAILTALAEIAFKKLSTVIQAVEQSAKGPVDYLRKVLPAYMRFGLAHSDEYRLAFLLVDPAEPVLPGQVGFRIEEGARIYASMERQVFAGIESGAIKNRRRSPRAVAQSVWAGIHGLVAVRLAFPAYEWVDAEEQIRVHAEILMDGLVAGEVRPGETRRRR